RRRAGLGELALPGEGAQGEPVLQWRRDVARPDAVVGARRASGPELQFGGVARRETLARRRLAEGGDEPLASGGVGDGHELRSGVEGLLGELREEPGRYGAV